MGMMQKRSAVYGARTLRAAVMATSIATGGITSFDAHAGKSQRWELETPAHFMTGRLDRLILTSDGTLRPGYGHDRIGEFAKEIWCSATGPDGRIYFGTGTPSDVYAVRDNGKPVLVLRTDAVAVTAMTFDAKGDLYVGTMANGKIYKLSADRLKSGIEADDDASVPLVSVPDPVWCQINAPYVWTLVTDKDGNLFVGSGPGGNIYRIGPDAKPEAWFAATDSNLLSLALDADGHLLAGGSDRGTLFRIKGKDNGEVLHEFEEDEVKCIHVRGEEVFVGVNRQKSRRPRTGGSRPSPAEFERITQELSARYGNRVPERQQEPEPPTGTRVANLLSGAVYVRRADGRMDKLASWETESILDMKLDAQNRVLVATSNEGRVYRVSSRQYWELLFDLREPQAMTLAVRDGRLAFVGTGNTGSGYSIDANLADTGVFTSDVHDTQFASRWGNLAWRGEGSVTLSTRSGNTRIPDSMWAPWLDVNGDSPSRVTSPPGRYIQIRALLQNHQSTVLDGVTLHMHTQNQRPEMGSVTVDEKTTEGPAKGKAPARSSTAQREGVDDESADRSSVKDQPGEARASGRPREATTKRRIGWSATDRDGDTLIYRLFFKDDRDKLWLPMPLLQPLAKSAYVWETESVPDGWYRVKVVASDELGNAQHDTMTDEQVSASFKVDNRRPDVLDMVFDPATGVLTGKARDALSLVAYLEYAVDGGDWKFVAPVDGIFDDRVEEWRVTVGSLSAGPHTLAVRATDEEGNMGVEKIGVTTPAAR